MLIQNKHTQLLDISNLKLKNPIKKVADNLKASLSPKFAGKKTDEEYIEEPGEEWEHIT
jgi:hypothetical protein